MADITTKYKSQFTGKEIDEGIVLARNAVPLDGSKPMTGNFVIRNSAPVISAVDSDVETQAALWQNSNQTVLSNRNKTGEVRNQRSIVINNSTLSKELNFALRFYETTEGVSTWYNILHTGSKPDGSYTGNGDATERVIDTKGSGNCIVIWSAQGSAFLTGANGIAFNSASIITLITSKAVFKEGKLTIASTDERVNANGVTYYYQVL